MRQPDRFRLSLLARVACAGAALAVPFSAQAAWELVPEVEITADSNDNPRLVPDGSAEVLPNGTTSTRLLTNVRLEFASFTPRGEITLEPAVRSDGYVDDVDEPLESTDAFLRSSGERRWERVEAGYDLDLSRERIVGTEFLNAGLVDLDVEDPAIVDSLLLGQNERRRRAVFAPYTVLSLDDRASLTIDARLTDVGYEGDTITSRTDFEDKAFGIQIDRELNQRDTLSGRVYGSRFDAEENENLTDTAGIAIGFTRLLSDIWTFDASVGVEKSDFEYLNESMLPVTGSDDNFTFQVGLRKRAERTRLNLDVRRSLSPDSFGFLAARDEFRTVLRRRLSPRLDGGVAFRFINTAALGGNSDVDRDYGRLELDLDWAIGELWSLTTRYEYSRRTIESPDGDAASNALSVGFAYRGRSRR